MIDGESHTCRMADSLRELRRQLTFVADRAWRPGLVYACGEAFVLAHGAAFTPVPTLKGIRRGAPKCCFGNAIALAITRGLRYVEGYALMREFPLAVHHGWNLDAEGRLVDCTWMNSGQAYLGVEFALGRAFDAAWNGDATVLDDWNRGWPIFQAAWHSEDYERWPHEQAVKQAMEAYARESDPV